MLLGVWCKKYNYFNFTGNVPESMITHSIPESIKEATCPLALLRADTKANATGECSCQEEARMAIGISLTFCYTYLFKQISISTDSFGAHAEAI